MSGPNGSTTCTHSKVGSKDPIIPNDDDVDMGIDDCSADASTDDASQELPSMVCTNRPTSNLFFCGHPDPSTRREVWGLEDQKKGSQPGAFAKQKIFYAVNASLVRDLRELGLRPYRYRLYTLGDEDGVIYLCPVLLAVGVDGTRNIYHTTREDCFEESCGRVGDGVSVWVRIFRKEDAVNNRSDLSNADPFTATLKSAQQDGGYTWRRARDQNKPLPWPLPMLTMNEIFNETLTKPNRVIRDLNHPVVKKLT
jgi:hypothetical protein